MTRRHVIALTKGERLIRIAHEHWMVYVRPTIIYLLLSGAAVLLVVFAGYAVTHVDWLAFLAFFVGTTLLLAVCHGFFFVILGEATSCFVITNHRVVHFKNIIIIREDMAEVSFEIIKTVEAHKRGILQYLFNYGSLDFEHKLTIDYVGHPNALARDVHQAMGLR